MFLRDAGFLTALAQSPPHRWSLLDSLERGDTLIVSELSRLGRSVGEIITTVDRLVHHQIRVFALKEGLRLTGARICSHG